MTRLIDEALSSWKAGEPISTRCASCGERLAVVDYPQIGSRWITCEKHCTSAHFKYTPSRSVGEQRKAEAPETDLSALVTRALSQADAPGSTFDQLMRDLVRSARSALKVQVGLEHDMTFAAGQALLIAINSHDELVDHGNIRELNRGFNWWRVGVHVSSRGPLWTVRVSSRFRCLDSIAGGMPRRARGAQSRAILRRSPFGPN
jgi:hypothetical protein